MDQRLSEGINEARQIRPFVFQKALFFFTIIIFCRFMFESDIARASIDSPVVGRSNIGVGSCTVKSIQRKQRLYKKQVFTEHSNLLSISDSSTESAGLNLRKIEEISFSVTAVTPHDTKAYTQGLVYHQGYLFESTGGLGTSDIRKVDLATGQTVNVKQLPDNYFAEGLTRVDNQLVQITLKKNLALVYDINDFKVIDQFKFPGDGWGLVAVGDNLLISDGSSVLRKISIIDHQLLAENQISANGVLLEGINEMEVINGLIYANIFPTDCIAIIDPEKYQVVAWINLTGLYPENKRLNQSSVLNGIAYDPLQNKLLVTGKYWPHVYHLKLSKYPARLLID